MPLQRFLPHVALGCLCTPVILQWNGLIDCCAPLFTFPASEQVSFGSRPLFHFVLPSSFQLPSSHQVQVHPGVTSCLVARDNQTVVYVTIISKALIPLSFSPSLIPLSLLPFLLFSFWLVFCPSDAMRSTPSNPVPSRPIQPLLQIHTLLIHSVQWFARSSHRSAHHACMLSTNQQPWLIKPRVFSQLK